MAWLLHASSRCAAITAAPGSTLGLQILACRSTAACMHAIITLDWHSDVFVPLQVAGAIKELVERLDGVRVGGTRALTPKEALVLRLNDQYPLDVGVLSAFFLNLVPLKAGQVPGSPPTVQGFQGLGICSSACEGGRRLCDAVTRAARVLPRVHAAEGVFLLQACSEHAVGLAAVMQYAAPCQASS